MVATGSIAWASSPHPGSSVWGPPRACLTRLYSSRSLTLPFLNVTKIKGKYLQGDVRINNFDKRKVSFCSRQCYEKKQNSFFEPLYYMYVFTYVNYDKPQFASSLVTAIYIANTYNRERYFSCFASKFKECCILGSMFEN